MPCDSQAREPVQVMKMASALDKLQKALALGEVKVTISPRGAVAFKGWQGRAGFSDLCAYRKLTARNSPELRRAVARAEVSAGRKIDPQAIAAGEHSHDGGEHWGRD